MRIIVYPVQGEKFTVSTILADQVAFENTARARQWGSIQESPMRAGAFLSWKAATRIGKFEGTFEEWCDSVYDATIDTRDTFGGDNPPIQKEVPTDSLPTLAP